MNREALKFTDLDAFFNVVEKMGYNGEIKELIYEQDKLPYCTAYFIPTHLLPPNFNINVIDRFAGQLAQVEEVQFLGTEEFNADFMIFPLSLVGYVEVNTVAPTIFVLDKTSIDWSTGEMNFVIYIEDGGGKEFFLAASGALIALTDQTQEEPQILKNHKQVTKHLDQLRPKYPRTCNIRALEKREFEARRKELLNPDS